MEMSIKTEPQDVKPFKVASQQKPLPIQLPRIKPKPPPVVLVTPQVMIFTSLLKKKIYCSGFNKIWYNWVV